MAHKLPSFTKDTSTSQGATGSVVVADSVIAGFNKFSAGLANGDTTIVVRDDDTGSGANDREVLYCTWDLSNTELDVISVLESTNGGSRVDWPSGTRNVTVAPAGKAAVARNSNGNTFDGDGQALAKEPLIDQGTKTTGTFTPNPSDGSHQSYTNGGAHTLAPTAEVTNGFIVIITNNGSAGAITTSGFDNVKGDSFDTTNTNVFECFITNTGSKSTLQVTALQ